VFKKMMASMGIGSAKVDTVLDDSEIVLGGVISGVINITGGNLEQQIDAVGLEFFTKISRENSEGEEYESSFSLAKFHIADAFLLGEDERRQFEFAFDMPAHFPISMDNQKYPVWVKTALDIDCALDPTDKDYITVLPPPALITVVDAIQALGFELAEVDIEHDPSRHLGFKQEFEFKPFSPAGGLTHLEEIEVVFLLEGDTLHAFIESEKHTAGGFFGDLMENLNLNESTRVLHLPLDFEDVERLTDDIGYMLAE